MTMTHTNIVWTDTFLIGIDELDYEHRVLIKDINRLHQELLEHDSKDKVMGTLGEIHARMQAHFALEEQFMQSRDYPHYPEHKAEHNALLDEYTEFMTRFGSAGALFDSQQAEAILSSWVVDHIVTSDKKISQMLTP